MSWGPGQLADLLRYSTTLCFGLLERFVYNGYYKGSFIFNPESILRYF